MENLCFHILTLTFLATSVAAFGQSITGPTTATAGAVNTYSYSDDVVYTNPNWTTTNGTVNSQTNSGLNHSCTITFNCGSSAVVNFQDGSTVKQTLNVTVNLPTVSTPSTAFTYTNNCGNTVITRTSNPNAFVYWYWETSAGGTDTSLGNGSTLTVTAPGTYYLRAQYKAATCAWSSSSLATSAVTVNPAVITAAAVSSCSGVAASIVVTNTYGISGASVSWTVSSNTHITGTSTGNNVSIGTGNTSLTAQTLTSNDTQNSQSVTYTITPSSNGCTGTEVTAVFTVKPKPVASGSNQTIFTSQATSITLSGSVSGSTFSYIVTPSNVSNAAGGSASPIAQTLTSTDGVNIGTATYTVTPTASGCAGSTSTVAAYVYPLPVISATTNRLTMGPVTLSTGTFDSYQWKNSAGTVVGTTQSYNAAAPDNYTVAVTKNGSAFSPLSAPYQIIGQFSGQTANSIVSYEMLVDGITAGVSLDGLPPESVSQTIQYFDGLGRPLQTVSGKGSPQKADLVQPFLYDAYGREYRKYLPFTYASDGWMKNGVLDRSFNYAGPALNYYNNSSDKIADDSRYFSETTYEPSPLNRPLQDFGPGNNWFTNNKYIGHNYYVNLDGNTTQGQEKIINWSIVSTSLNSQTVYLVSQNGYWPANSFNIKVTTDENGNQVREYTDRQGRMLLKKIQYTATPNTYDDTQWTLTYYVYDDFDRLRFVLPPEFNTRITTYNADAAQDQSNLLAAWAFQYTYDERGRMATKQVPGAGVVYMVYDLWDRPVLSQDANQRANNRWAFTKYDVFDRPIITGEFSSSNNQSAMVTAVNAVTTRFETAASGTVGYTLNQTYPTTVALTDIQHITYYDDYSFKTNLSLGTAYDFLAITGTAYPTTFMSLAGGKVTGSKINVLGSTQWLISATYYDNRYRVIQTISDDHLGNKNRATSCYSGITPWVTKSRLDHGSLMVSVAETHFDHKGRPLSTHLTMDSGPRIMTDSLKYNEIGQLVEKNLHSTDNGTTYLQSVDSRYNIRGWLTSINNSGLTNDSGVTNDDTNDLFGMQMSYEQSVSVDGTNTTTQFNGNISSMQWGTNDLTDPIKQKIYGFTYDPLNRLTQSSYASYSGTTWSGDGNMYNEALTYDRNGNILSLNRNSLFNGAMTAIDQLAYTYTSITGNQLLTVNDNSAYGNMGDNNPDYGYSELQNSPNTEYGYDANGNMTWDLNTGITSITYNYLNKPVLVTLSNPTRTVQYTYDAAGTKLKKVATQSGTQIAQSDYVGPVQYENSVLAFMQMPEGRAVKNGTAWNYEYFLRDHLGNTRAVFAYTNKIDEYKATMEPALATTEESLFQNLPASRLQMATYNHTAKSYQTPSPDRVAETNGYTGKTVGPAKLLQVRSGDQITAQAYARYTTGTGGSTAVVNTLLTAVTGAFGLTSGESGYTAFSNNLGTIAGGLTANSSVPKSYLIYILFKSDYSAYQFGYQMVSVAAQAGPELLTTSVTVPSTYDNGYLYIYVADESNVASASSVYFDDVYIKNIEFAQALQVTQVTDYYPFGLAINPLKYQKSVTYQNKYQYNGKELQADFSLNWIDYEARMYEPQIGRWIVIDPWAEKFGNWSSYSYGFDNPPRYSDFMGMGPNDEVTMKESRVYSADVAPGVTAVTQMDISRTTTTNDDGTTTTTSTVSVTQNTITKDNDGNTTVDYGKTQSATRTETKNADGKQVAPSNTSTATSKNSCQGKKEFQNLNAWTNFIKDFNANNSHTANEDVIYKGGAATAVAGVVGQLVPITAAMLSFTAPLTILQPAATGGGGVATTFGELNDVVIRSISLYRTRNGETVMLHPPKSPDWNKK